MPTNTTIKAETKYFSHVRGRRESGVIKPVVMAQAKIMNLARPVAIQENGGKKLSAALYLVVAKIAMSIREKK